MNHGDSCYGRGDFGLVTSRMLFFICCLSDVVIQMLSFICCLSIVVDCLLSFRQYLSYLQNIKMNCKHAFKSITVLQINSALCWKWDIQPPIKKLASSYVQVCYLTRKTCGYTILPCTQVLCLLIHCRGRRWATMASLLRVLRQEGRLVRWSGRLLCGLGRRLVLFIAFLRHFASAVVFF